MSEGSYERPAKVMLPCANMEFINVAEVKFVNIEEDPEGRDVMTFRCPQCDWDHKSLIFT